MQSEGIVSNLKDFSLLLSNPMGPIYGSQNLFFTANKCIKKWTLKIHYTRLFGPNYMFILFFKNSTLHVYSRLHVYSERESSNFKFTVPPELLFSKFEERNIDSLMSFFDNLILVLVSLITTIKGVN